MSKTIYEAPPPVVYDEASITPAERLAGLVRTLPGQEMPIDTTAHRPVDRDLDYDLSVADPENHSVSTQLNVGQFLESGELALGFDLGGESITISGGDKVAQQVGAEKYMKGAPVHREAGHILKGGPLHNMDHKGQVVYSPRREHDDVYEEAQMFTIEYRGNVEENKDQNIKEDKDLHKIEHVSQQELNAFLDTLNGKQNIKGERLPRGVHSNKARNMAWKLKENEADPTNTSVVAVNLPDYPYGNDEKYDPFEAIASDLEGKNITSWKGLTWEEERHDKAPHEKARIDKRRVINGETEHTKESFDRNYWGTLEIVRETTIVQTVSKATGGGEVQVPGFVVKCTDEQGRTRSLEFMTDDQLRAHFKKIEIGPGRAEIPATPTTPFVPAIPSNNVRIVTPDRQNRPPQDPVELANQQAALELIIADDTAGLPLNKETAEAAWLLSEAAYVLVGDPNADAKKRTAIQKVLNDPENIERLDAVKDMVAIHGLPAIMDIALELQENYIDAAKELKLPYNKARPGSLPTGLAKKLGLPLEKDIDPKTIVWAVESLAKLHEEGYNAFTDDDAGDINRRSIIDQRIGELFRTIAIVPHQTQKNKKIPGTNLVETNKKGKPKIVTETELAPVDEMLNRNGVKDITTVLLKVLDNGQPAPRQLYAALGRELRRAVRK